MQVNCSNCHSNYSYDNKDVGGLNRSIITCSKCNNFIKIILCPHCKSFYSVTFTTVDSPKYRFQCKKCSKSFVVEFPVIKEPLKKNKIENRDKKNEKIKAQKGKDVLTHKPVYKKSESKNENRQKQRIVFKGKTLTGFSVKEVFSICFTSLRLSKIIAATLCIISIIMLLTLFNGLETAILANFDISNSRNIKSFVQLFPFAIIFSFYILSASLISRITLEEIFNNRKLSIKNSLAFLTTILGSVLISNITVLVLLNSIFLLFGMIPGVGPVIFSILFLPIYIFSFLIISVSVLGFWFYPPIIAFRNTGIVDNIKNLYHFFKKHNFVLVYIIPILTIVSTLIFSIIYMFHVGAISLTMIFARGVPNENIDKVFSSIPMGFLKISEFSFFGIDAGFFKSLMNNIFLNHQFGGALIGFVTASISIILFASFISIISTLSTHIYVLMERGIDVDDGKKLRILSILVLILIGIYFIKRAFM